MKLKIINRATAMFAAVFLAWSVLSFVDLALRAEARRNRNEMTPAERGYQTLRTKSFLPPDFDDEVFADLWKAWPEPFHSRAENAREEERRRMTFSYYGLVPSPKGEKSSGKALGYVDDGAGGWVMNCLVCHGGKVAGRVIPGLPNTHYALQTLTEDVRLVKLAKQKKLSHMDFGSLAMPLGTSNGTTNSVMFGVALGALRDRDLNVRRGRPVPKLTHHDLDAPPFWNVKKKKRLYYDGASPKNHRMLMQFILLPRNGPDKLKEWEDDFRDILAWIESVEPPKYFWKIDKETADVGRVIFGNHCSRCHGTYGKDGKYNQKTIPIEIVKTDPVRLQALTVDHRRWLKESWLSYYGRDSVILEPGGYVAPPLDGIWASAPYFHNGSVPTLWHVLHADKRPAVWKRSEDGYDRRKIGLEVEELEELPSTVTIPSIRRRYFDSRKTGKSATGHRFPEKLTEDEKHAVLEYLKTL